MARTKKSSKVKPAVKKSVYSLPADKYLTKIESDIKANPSKVSMVLGALIVLVIGILSFNYLNKSKPSLGPAQQNNQQETISADVTPDNLPGKYTVKDGDTLFLIAEKYYKDGEKFTEIAKANNLSDVNTLEVGQALEIPKLADVQAMATPTTTTQPTASPEASASPAPTASAAPVVEPTPAQDPPAELAVGGGNTTIWGPKIEGSTYTVQEGDWLSTIAARAYGDILSYEKLAAANNIQNPDYIVPGQVLNVPR